MCQYQSDILESDIKNTNWTEFNNKLFTNSFYQVVVSSPKKDWPDEYPPANETPAVLWINPDNGEMYYRSDYNQPWRGIYQAVFNLDGGDFSEL